MLDRFTIAWLRPSLESTALWLHRRGVTADAMTIAAFAVGMSGIGAIACGWPGVGLALILLNRLGDGLDGPLARIGGATDAGGFLDIVLDFLFYSGVIFAFALADPGANALAAAALILSFVGTGSSFLAYAIMAERRRLVNIVYPHKGFYYLGGLTEGTETILFFVVICLFPSFFPFLAALFTLLCLLTTVARIWGGYRTLVEAQRRDTTVTDPLVSDDL